MPRDIDDNLTNSAVLLLCDDGDMGEELQSKFFFKFA